jgi:hypothetical protein
MIEVAARKDAIEREAGYVTDSTKPSHFFREHVKAPCYPYWVLPRELLLAAPRIPFLQRVQLFFEAPS